MTSGDFDPFYGKGHEPGAYSRSTVQLAGRLEAFAQSQSADYREDLEDGFGVAINTSDLGGTLDTEISFGVERIREEVLPGIYGPPICSTFTIISTIKRRQLALDDIPRPVQDFLLTMGSTPSELRAEGVDFGFGFSQTFSITSAGDFEHEYGLCVYVDDEPEDLPDDVLEAVTVSPTSASIDKSNGINDEFASFLTEEDMIALQGIGKKVAVYVRPNVLLQFKEELSVIQHASQAMRLRMVDNLVAQIASPTDR